MEYAVSVKLGAPSGFADDWAYELPRIPGVAVFGSVKRGRVIVKADDQAIRLVRERFGENCRIEPVIEH